MIFVMFKKKCRQSALESEACRQSVASKGLEPLSLGYEPSILTD